MKKLASLFVALFSLVWLTGAGWLPLAQAPGGGCSQATTFLARTSGLSGTETTAYTNLICGLVTDGIITGSMSGANSGAGACGLTLDALYIFATNTTTTAALNLCGTSYSLITHGTITFSADHGYTGNGTTGYLDPVFVPSTVTTPNFVQNSASVGGYILNSRASGSGNAGAIVGAGNTVFVLLLPLDSSNRIQYDMNLNATIVVANTNAQGFLVSTRTSSVLTSVYRNGNTTPVGTDTTASAGVSTDSITIAAVDGASNFSSDQISAVFIGAGLSSASMQLISNRVNAYMTALSINVY